MRETISSVSQIIIMISMLVFLMSIIWCIVRLFRRKKIKPSLILSASSIGAFILFTIIGATAWSGTEEYKIAMAEREQKEIEQEKLDKKEEALEKKETEKKKRAEEQDASEESKKTEESQKEKETEEKIKSEKPETNNDDVAKENATEKSEDKFLTDFKSVADEKIANGAYDVLKNQIGFLDIEFKEQLGDTSNYEITGDGTYMVITAMEDYYRVFIPDTSYIFYEDGKVIMTAAEFSDKIISNDDRIVYYIMAQDIVSQYLKNPSSANFPSINFSSQDIAMNKTGDIITVQSYVEARNSFNAKVISNWIVQFVATDKNTFSYEMRYVNIDGESVGEYTEIE